MTTGIVIAKAVRANATVVEWDGKPIPSQHWGKDHWATLAYAETRVVDYHGVLDGRHMRGRDAGYPTRCVHLVDVIGHGDLDCLKDMEAVGLLEVQRGYMVQRRGKKGRFFVLPDDRRPTDNWVFAERVVLTELGLDVAGALRRHKAAGKNFAEFCWQPSTV